MSEINEWLAGYIYSMKWHTIKHKRMLHQEYISESDRAILSRAAADRKMAMDADMYSDRVFLCMCYRVLNAGAVDQRVDLPGVYIDEYHSVESQMVFNYGKSPTIAGTNVVADSDSMFCTHVKYITSHLHDEISSLCVFRQQDDGIYIRVI